MMLPETEPNKKFIISAHHLSKRFNWHLYHAAANVTTIPATVHAKICKIMQE